VWALSKRRRVEPCTWIVDSGNEEPCVTFGCQLSCSWSFPGVNTEQSTCHAGGLECS